MVSFRREKKRGREIQLAIGEYSKTRKRLKNIGIHR